jgi:aryl-phospho-beta-D-glucosidase BglC (GH1 family)
MDTFVGEWSLAVTDCQLYLDGGYADPYVPVASESTCAYYNSNFTTYPADYIQFLQDFIRAQMDSHESKGAGSGWFFWTAKTENNCAPEWDYIFLLDNGIAPADLCTRTTYCS